MKLSLDSLEVSIFNQGGGGVFEFFMNGRRFAFHTQPQYTSQKTPDRSFEPIERPVFTCLLSETVFYAKFHKEFLDFIPSKNNSANFFDLYSRSFQYFSK